MTTLTLVTVPPDTDIDVEVTPVVDTSEFNDGYQQTTGRGVFNSPRKIPVKWTNLYYADATALISFLGALKGYKKFYYTMSEEPERIYKCTKFSYKWKKGRKCEVSASFEEQAG